MRTHNKWIASLVTGSVVLAGPLTSFAAEPAKDADADVVSEEEILDVIQNAPQGMSIDGRGGGYGGIYPVYGGGVQVDVSVTKEVTPDFVALNAYCNSGKKDSQQAVRDTLNQIYQDIKNAVGNDGRVRKAGMAGVYPIYGPAGETSGGFTGDLNIFIRPTSVSSTQRISDLIESKGCGVNWDVRLMDTQTFELSALDELSSRMTKRKAVFEKILGKELDTIIGATLNTWVDGYGTYDAESNKVDATTTLSVSFELGTAKKAESAATRSSARRAQRTAPAVAPRG